MGEPHSRSGGFEENVMVSPLSGIKPRLLEHLACSLTAGGGHTYHSYKNSYETIPELQAMK
jgi:hypothetical protein